VGRQGQQKSESQSCTAAQACVRGAACPSFPSLYMVV
jgi:hypothetical protein